MALILTFFVAHWVLSLFFHSFFLHRYGSHRMFTMSHGWERFFHLCSFVFMGSSYIIPSAYAVMHREHHAFADGPKDPHSPHVQPGFMAMMLHTRRRFEDLLHQRVTPEARFEGGYPSWPALDRLGDRLVTRFAFGALYTLFYLAFAPSAYWLLLLPVHYMMGAVQGGIVNWCGHKYGYRNFAGAGTDRSRNTLPMDLPLMGELFQNNHHRFPMSPNFGARWFELDPTYWGIRGLAALGIVKFSPHVQHAHVEHRPSPARPRVA